ncbi:Diacylglycerol kinase family enzyme [Granulicella rosea]|uniref:Diacylglycerol kinase family enzyme n=1 Tax=Granulicella rosea TaxID=474952 RepID=A0A239DR69_9BACT|nr:diacylglycerol kinase family protein [Granulicella rosea]SNS34611.1 Diacylglycerol kinase family enzyme [Granulicella rosea]
MIEAGAGIASLIVNPAAGRARLLAAQLSAIRELLARRGYRTEIFATTSEPGSAEAWAREAAERSAAVFACGGDGTVHGVVQGMAGSACPLGVVPLGTANALARNLGLPLDPLGALTQLMNYQPQAIPLGEIVSSAGTRRFTVMAGCGPDGALVHALDSRLKSRFGRQAYYLHAARLFTTRRWPAFRVSYRLAGSAEWRHAEAAAVMASRIPDLGGLFSGLTRAARLDHPHLHVHLLRAPAQLSFPAWFGLTKLGLPNPWLTTVDMEELLCTPLGARPVYAQADGEPLGTLPMTLRIVPGALRLLMPG